MGSHKIVNWRCHKCGYEWEASIKNRSKDNGTNCPCCSGKKIIRGINDICTTHSELIQEWNYDKNIGILPEDFSKGSHRKVWWICQKCSYEWQAVISSRTQGHGCPSCIRRKKGDITKRNDIFTSYPELLEEWDYDLNEYDPQNILASSERMIHWICSQCGYKWKQTPYNRAIRKSGCPVCANRVIIPGVNDLKTQRPELMNEWNYGRNSNINPENLSVGTNKKVWWICEKRHEWQATVSNRSKARNTGCPFCDSERKTSMPEKTIVFYLQPYFGDIIESYKPDFFHRGELDIFIPSLSLAIKYDGERFHQNVDRDIAKANLCKENGIVLLRIREPKCPKLPETIRTYICESVYEDTLDVMVQNVIKIINEIFSMNIIIDVNVERDRAKNLQRYTTIEKGNSLCESLPELVREWDLKKIWEYPLKCLLKVLIAKCGGNVKKGILGKQRLTIGIF